MNKTEFFKNLKNVKDRFNWNIDESGNIRGGLKHKNQNTPNHCTFCPIEAVAYCKLKKKSYYCLCNLLFHGYSLGLSRHVTCSIVNAADKVGYKHTRKQLREILGV